MRNADTSPAECHLPWAWALNGLSCRRCTRDEIIARPDDSVKLLTQLNTWK